MLQSMTVWPCPASSRAKVLGRGRRTQDRTQRPPGLAPTQRRRIMQHLQPATQAGIAPHRTGAFDCCCVMPTEGRYEGIRLLESISAESGLRRPLVLSGSRLPVPGMVPTDFQAQRSKPSGRNGIVGALTDSQARLWRVYCVAAVMHAVLSIRPTRVDGSGGAGRLSASRKRPAS